MRAVELLRASFLELAIATPPPSAEAPPTAPVVERFATATLEEADWTWAVEAGGGTADAIDGPWNAILSVARIERAFGRRFCARITFAGLGTAARVDTPERLRRRCRRPCCWPSCSPAFGAGGGSSRWSRSAPGRSRLAADSHESAPYEAVSGARWAAAADAGVGVRVPLRRHRFELGVEVARARRPALPDGPLLRHRGGARRAPLADRQRHAAGGDLTCAHGPGVCLADRLPAPRRPLAGVGCTPGPIEVATLSVGQPHQRPGRLLAVRRRTRHASPTTTRATDATGVRHRPDLAWIPGQFGIGAALLGRRLRQRGRHPARDAQLQRLGLGAASEPYELGAPIANIISTETLGGGWALYATLGPAATELRLSLRDQARAGLRHRLAAPASCPGAWTHLAAVVDGDASTLTLYVNGVARHGRHRRAARSSPGARCSTWRARRS